MNKFSIHTRVSESLAEATVLWLGLVKIPEHFMHNEQI